MSHLGSSHGAGKGHGQALPALPDSGSDPRGGSEDSEDPGALAADRAEEADGFEMVVGRSHEVGHHHIARSDPR